MDHDLLLVLGVVFGGFAIPPLLSSFSEGRTPKGAFFVMFVSSCLVMLAARTSPERVELGDIPAAFVSVVTRYIL